MRTRWRGGEPGERAGRKGRGGDKDENSQLFCVLHKEQRVYGSLIRTCLKESQLKLPRHLAIIYLAAPRRPLKPGPCMVTSRPCVRGSPAQGPPIRPTADSGCQVLAGCDVDTRGCGSFCKQATSYPGHPPPPRLIAAQYELSRPFPCEKNTSLAAEPRRCIATPTHNPPTIWSASDPRDREPVKIGLVEGYRRRMA